MPFVYSSKGRRNNTQQSLGFCKRRTLITWTASWAAELCPVTLKFIYTDRYTSMHSYTPCLLLTRKWEVRLLIQKRLCSQGTGCVSWLAVLNALVISLAHFSLFSLNSELSKFPGAGLQFQLCMLINSMQLAKPWTQAGIALSFHGLSLHFSTYAGLP